MGTLIKSRAFALLSIFTLGTERSIKIVVVGWLAWSKWRLDNPQVVPDLTQADPKE